MIKSYTKNCKEYDNKYSSGYGLQYPEGYIIRICKQIIEFQEKMSNPTILDYGCGNGIHLEYFSSLWPTSELFGLDISSNAIEQAKKRTSLVNARLEVCKPVPDINNIYLNQKYDLILSNQVLYYLEDKDVKNLINQFYDLIRNIPTW